MNRPLLEVIALDAADAVAAEAGGADRLEVVAEMAADGLTPSIAVVAKIHEATGLPLRVMLRSHDGFGTDAADVERLRTAASELAAVGAEGFVLGFLTAEGDLDLAAMRAVANAVVDAPWTCHRAIDRVRDPDAAWAAVTELPGLSSVLTAGSAAGVDDGLPALLRRAASPGAAVLVLAGGGLRPDHVPPLLEAGVRGFHVGRLARRHESWAEPVETDLVARWRTALDRPQVL
jgi:copper homeostasis protein